MKKKDEPEPKRRRKTRSDAAAVQEVAQTTDVVEEKKTVKRSSSRQDSSTSVSKQEELSVDQLEENQAEQRDSQNDAEMYKNTCTEIVNLVTEINELKINGHVSNIQEITSKRSKVTLLTTNLKKLNRLSQIRGKKARESTQEVKQKVDALHLDLQNLLYEIMHMKKEIRKCMEFTSKDEDIDLVSVADFYQDAPEEISKPSITKKDSHQKMLARLDWELQQRKKFATMKEEFVKSKQEIVKEISTKQEYLSSLQPSLQNILKATLPLQERMELPIDKNRVQFETAMYLSKPLYILYVQSSAYGEACDSRLRATIEGDVQAAKAMLLKSEERDRHDSDYSDFEDNAEGEENEEKEEDKNRKHREDRGKARLEEQRKSLLKSHPLAVRLKLNCKDEIAVCLEFSYIPSLQIVTVAISIELLKDQDSPIITSSSLLSPHTVFKDLFPGDHGSGTPNSSNHYQLKKLGMEKFSHYIPDIGTPYYWAQWICGLQYLPNEPNQNVLPKASFSTQHMESVIKSIRRRISSRISLQKQLSSLETLVVPTSKNTMHLFPSKIISRLTTWKCITYEDYKAFKFTSPLVEAEMICEEGLFYLLIFEWHQVSLQAAIAISIDHPARPPLFSLQVMSEDGSKITDDSVREMECEVNTHFVDFVDIDRQDQVLSNQIQTLRMCFDIYCDVDLSDPIQDRFYMRKYRGRNRTKPFKYIEEKGFFSHR